LSDFVVVHRVGNPVDAELLGDILEQERIPHRVLGGETHSSLIGTSAGHYRFEVHRERAEEALAVIEAFLSEVETEGTSEDLPWELREADELADDASGRLSLDEGGGELTLLDQAGQVSLADGSAPPEIDIDDR